MPPRDLRAAQLSGPAWDRTTDLLHVEQALWPAELQAQRLISRMAEAVSCQPGRTPGRGGGERYLYGRTTISVSGRNSGRELDRRDCMGFACIG